MEKDNLIVENNYLKFSIQKIKELIIEEEKRFKELTQKYRDNPFLLQTMMSLVGMKVNNLHLSKDKPYFARIDFENNSDITTQTCYIGKIGIISKESEVIVVDWRAPIASIYYDNNIGKVQYVAPEGIIEGILKLKRQIVIEDGILKSIFDVDSVSDDELLKPYLGVNADNRLKNIVASIQKEQNQIIRNTMEQNIIVQGVAGSGKTTVALHRISYLIYNYKQKDSQEKFMVIGPNKFFINYISNVLPDLDVINAKQWTFEEFAIQYLNEKISIISDGIEDINMNSGKCINKIKTSMKYKEMIDKFLIDYQNSFFDNEGLLLGKYCIVKSRNLKTQYYNDVLDLCIKKKIEKISNIVEKKVSERANLIKERIRKDYQISIENEQDDKKKKEIKDEQFMLYKELNLNMKNELKKYFAKTNIKATALYKLFIENIYQYIDNDNVELFNEKYLKKKKIDMSKKIYEFEDIPALMYIKYRLVGQEEFKNYVHCVIDESQDFGDFHFYVLKQLLSKSTFTIFGDLAQSIYSYRAIENWESVVSNVFNNECKLLKLEKSYRTSIEIMEEANKINKYLNLDLAIPVIRHGKKVMYVQIKNLEEKVEYVKNKVREDTSSGYKSIAIIGKNIMEVKEFYEYIKNEFELELVVRNSEVYNGGVCILPSYLSKGLEFDSVIIINAEEGVYDSNNSIDMKLLYVSMTRPLHELTIIYKEKLVKSLNN